jgi:hypothetical protein
VHNLPSPPPPLWDPLSAISPEDKILLDNCWEKLMGIAMESCSLCHEEWFDLGVEDGVCKNCRKNSKFQPSNNMYRSLSPSRTYTDGGHAHLSHVIYRLSAGLSFVAISQVKTLKGLALCTHFNHTQLKRSSEASKSDVLF